MELIGTSPFSGSGLFANAIVGTGDGGDLTISTEKLIVRDGATISASNFSSLNPNIPPGLGLAGNIQVSARSMLLDNTSPESLGGITASTNEGGGGNIDLHVKDEIIARNGSRISAETLGSGKGGSINITTDELELTNGAGLTVSSQGSGDAGDLEVVARSIHLDNQGKLLAETASGQGGNITLQAQDLLLLRNNISHSNCRSPRLGGQSEWSGCPHSKCTFGYTPHSLADRCYLRSRLISLCMIRLVSLIIEPSPATP